MKGPFSLLPGAVESLLVCLLAIHTSSVKFLLKSFAHLKNLEVCLIIVLKM